MDQIKFRGKNMLDKWVCGSYLYDTIHDRHFILTYDGAGNIRESRVNPKTVGQYTGRHDSHNIDIYGGDILGYEDKHTDPVKWDKEFLMWKIGKMMLWALRKDATIIGNITDNPKLMEN